MLEGHIPSSLDREGYCRKKQKICQAHQDSPEIFILSHQLSGQKASRETGDHIYRDDPCRNRSRSQIHPENKQRKKKQKHTRKSVGKKQ